MFDILKYENIKVVIVGHSPYPGKCSITKMNVLLGKDTWFLSSYARDKVLKFHHPTSRDESQFLGYDMFKKINEPLEVPIDF